MEGGILRKTILLLGLAIVLIACAEQGPVCNPPYMIMGTSCCLDKDGDAVCDSDEGGSAVCEEAELDCSLCPPVIVTETQIEEETRYVCADAETVVRDPEDCKEILDPEPDFSPITTNEFDEPAIESFTVRPACRGGFNGVEVYFKIPASSQGLRLQYKDSEEALYETAFNMTSNVIERYLYGVFCETQCTENADFILPPDGVYLFRGKFDFTDTSFDRMVNTNEHIIDASDDGEYATKLC